MFAWAVNDMRTVAVTGESGAYMLHAPNKASKTEATLFSLTDGSFNPSIWETGQYTYNASTGVGTLYTGQYGFGGWKSDGGFDVSDYESMTITLAEAPTEEVAFRIFDVNNYHTTPAKDVTFSGKTSITVDISTIDKIYIAGFWSYGNTGGNFVNHPIKIKSVTLTKMAVEDSGYEPNVTPGAIEVTTSEAKDNSWDSQVRYKLPKAMTKGHQYTIIMTAKASSRFDIQAVAVWDASSNKDEWGGSADVQYLGGTVTTSWRAIAFETNGNFAYDYLFLNIGKLGGWMQISNIKIIDKSTGATLSDDNMTSTAAWSKVSYHNHVSYGAPHEDFVFTGYDDADYTLMPLHQEGKYFVNTKGDKVTLHGVMDTPNWYFNNDRWPLNWGNPYNNDDDVRNCLGYFETLLTAFTNHEAGSYCDLFRLHLDPAWTNDRNIEATNGGDENDISRFSPDRLRTYMDKLYWPIIEKAMAKGLYVIVRPPGVCPQTIQVGGEYQEYLKTVWGIVSSDARIKKYAGQIMIELANEPIQVLSASGVNSNNDPHVLHDFFQPIVDVIRANGFKGIVLASGSGYQSQYGGYGSYPITGDNIGYAVHFYPGWMGTDRTFDNNTIISQFKTQVPVVNSRPIVITEIDWSPEKSPRVLDHVNEMGQNVYKNYGTWGTGRSDGFGKAFRAVHDYYGNISMTLTHPYEYVDFDKLFNEGIVTYSFQSEAEPKQACSYYCFNWYREIAYDHRNPSYQGDDEEEDLDGDFYLTKDMFYNWTAADASGKQIQKSGCAYVLNESTDMPYGDASVVYVNYADLSKANKLYVTATAGEPRFLFNRIVDNGTVNVEIPGNGDAYEEVITNQDGSKTFIVDVKAIVQKYGFAHLHAIKGANWANVTVTDMHYTLDRPDYTNDPFLAEDFIASAGATFNPDERSLTGGDGGWSYAGGLDLSKYKYLVITSGQNRSECKASVWASISDGTKTISQDDGKEYTVNGKGLWLDNWNNHSIIVLDLKKMKADGFDIASIKSLTFGFWGTDKLILNNVYATNTLPAYEGDYARNVVSGDKFGTICLPYDAAYSGAYVYEITGKSSEGIYINRVDLMEAGKSYIYQSIPNYEGNSTHQAIFYRAGFDETTKVKPSNGLVGTYTAIKSPVSNADNSYYVISNNELYRVTSEVNVDAYRAYLDLNAIADHTNAKSRLIPIWGDGANAIADMNIDQTAVPVAYYTLSGIKVDRPQPGVNIVKMSNGKMKKIIIK